MIEGSRKDRHSKRKLKNYKFKIALILLSSFLLLFAVGISSYLVYLAYAIDDVVLQGNVNPSGVYSTNNAPLGIIEAGAQEYVPLDEISPYFVNAVIAVEDNVFYSHRGINPTSIARAMYVNIRNRRVIQGGSTITQQLAKNIYLTHERTMDRKLKELVYTFKLERRYSKDEILEAYLNSIYYGHGTYGVLAASDHYFKKHPSDLTLDEAALLAGIIQGPYFYTPFRPQNLAARDKTFDDDEHETTLANTHPSSRTYTRRSFVLNRMVQQEYITPEQADEARDKPFPDSPRSRDQQIRAPQEFILDELDRLEQLLGLERGQLLNGHNIFTTIDETAQMTAQETVRNFRDYLPENQRDKEGISSAIVAMDPSTGAVLAMAGGRNAYEGVPQPGSSLKPIAYALALESQQYNLATQHYCTDITGFDPNNPNYGPSDYSPDDTPRFHEENLAMRRAIVESCNIYAVLTNHELGPANVRDFAGELGLDTGALNAGTAMILGASGHNMPDMATVYAVFANGGYRVEPYIIEEITDSFGNVIYRRPPQNNERVISEETAFLITDTLRDVLNHGTARSGKPFIPNRDAAVKTGTTNDYAYMAGYTPEMVSVAYVGFDFLKGNLNLTGGGVSSLWADFTNKSLDGMFGPGVGGTFSPPQGIVEKTLCEDTMLLATPNCPNPFSEYFIAGTGPETYCDVHQQTGGVVSMCLDSWQRATEYCPQNRVRRFNFRPGQQIPTEECEVHTENTR